MRRSIALSQFVLCLLSLEACGETCPKDPGVDGAKYANYGASQSPEAGVDLERADIAAGTISFNGDEMTITYAGPDGEIVEVTFTKVDI